MTEFWILFFSNLVPRVSFLGTRLIFQQHRDAIFLQLECKLKALAGLSYFEQEKIAASDKHRYQIHSFL